MGSSSPRMTLPTQAVLRVLVDDPSTGRYGLQIGAETGLPSGTIHPILARLEHLGWLKSRWEDVDPRAQGRPRRRYYQLTDSGLVSARQALAEAHAARTRITTRLQPIGETT